MLEEYNYELRQIEGNKNVITDALSRITVIKNIPETSWFDTIIAEMTQKGLKIGMLPDRFTQNSSGKAAIPKNELEKFVKELHCLLGLPGSNKLWYTIKPYVTSKSIRKTIENTCSKCYKYQFNKLRVHSIGYLEN